MRSFEDFFRHLSVWESWRTGRWGRVTVRSPRTATLPHTVDQASSLSSPLDLELLLNSLSSSLYSGSDFDAQE